MKQNTPQVSWNEIQFFVKDKVKHFFLNKFLADVHNLIMACENNPCPMNMEHLQLKHHLHETDLHKKHAVWSLTDYPNNCRIVGSPRLLVDPMTSGLSGVSFLGTVLFVCACVCVCACELLSFNAHLNDKHAWNHWRIINHFIARC